MVAKFRVQPGYGCTMVFIDLPTGRTGITGMDQHTRIGAWTTTLSTGETDASPLADLGLLFSFRDHPSQGPLHTTEAVLIALANAVEARDGSTGRHCDRLMYNARVFGEALGLSGLDLEVLRWAGILHDVGKVGVRDSVLLKRGPLTVDEWADMQAHVVIGESIVKPLVGLETVVPIVRSHHERWDGTGYPDGLAGSAIPFLARVFQIVDVFDALTAPRPYKPAVATEWALDIMRKEAGSASDPELFAVFAADVAERCLIEFVPDDSRVDTPDQWDPWSSGYGGSFARRIAARD